MTSTVERGVKIRCRRARLLYPPGFGEKGVSSVLHFDWSLWESHSPFLSGLLVVELRGTKVSLLSLRSLPSLNRFQWTFPLPPGSRIRVEKTERQKRGDFLSSPL